MERYTITSALPYTNGPIHIGHIAGAYLPADLFVRYLRLKGKDVVYICGSDEHGAAITLKAKQEGISPRDIVDKYHAIIKKAFKDFGISFDIYHRTSASLHHETAKGFFKVLHEKGAFVEKVSEQYFDPEHQMFLADRYIVGTCPKCQFEDAYGDQCERCGSTLSPRELVNPRSKLSGATPILKETKHWYLSLDKHQDWLGEWINKGTIGGDFQHDSKHWKRNVVGQCNSWLQDGLQPRSMTRDLDWGVDVPLEDAIGKKLYVWLDAPIGYISATRQWAEDNGKDWELYWKEQENSDANSKLIHFIGKDNIVFHCIIFPAILKTHGGYILPENVPANEFLNLEGEKISTSRNWAVWIHEYLEELPGKQDELRYVLGSILPENKDSEFTWKDYQTRINSELVAILGNFVNRVIVLSDKYFKGLITGVEGWEQEAASQAALAEIQAHVEKVEQSISTYRFRDAFTSFINIARVGNKYLTDQEPWKKWKKDKEAVPKILFTCLQIIGKLGILSKIFLPNTANKIAGLLQLTDNQFSWEDLSKDELVPAGHQIFSGKAKLLFEKIDDKLVEQQLEKLEASKRARLNVAPQKEETTFDDFQKMDIRIGTVLAATKVKKSKKLLKLTVDTGLDKRTIVSGVSEFFKPEDLIGKQIPVLINLKPRKIRGVVSQGMALFAEDSQGTLHLLTPEAEVDKGSSVN